MLSLSLRIMLPLYLEERTKLNCKIQSFERDAMVSSLPLQSLVALAGTLGSLASSGPCLIC